MKKISLQMDALRVESFETTSHPAALRGTVKGAGTGVSACLTECGGESCDPTCQSCELTQCQAETCGFTCENTCGGPSCELTQCEALTCNVGC